MAITRRSGVYHLLPVYHLRTNVGIEFLASECLLPYFLKLLRTLYPSLVVIVMSELTIMWWVKSSIFVAGHLAKQT